MKIRIVKEVKEGQMELSLFYHKDDASWVKSKSGREFTGHTNGTGQELYSLLHGRSESLLYKKHRKDFSGVEKVTPENCLKKIQEVREWIEAIEIRENCLQTRRPFR